MRRAAIVAPLRTPVGKFLGALRELPAERLAQIIIEAVVAKSGVDPARIGDVPVRIRLDPAQPSWARLRPGLSTRVTIQLR